MQKHTLLFSLLLAPLFLLAQPKIQLLPFATGFDRPVDIAHCGDSRLFIVEQDGKIWILDSLGNRLPEFFLDIDARVQSNGNEQGLLGLAFHPDFADNGYFYVYYTRQSDGDNRLSRFSLLPGEPNKGDPDSEVIYFTQDDLYSNHNGGCIKFGPDGYLYVGLGDGGSGGDPQNSGQTKNTLLGKILRIDVDGSAPGLNYGIPPDNPFVGDPAYRPEIWSLGWRNPWRFSFDRLTGDLWVGDVGQGNWEEIDFEPAGTAGLNYGWRCYEGTHAYNTNGCQGASAYEPPIFEYSHSGGNGCSVTGGFRYRGSQYPDLYGRYVFADYCSGRWWQTRQNADGSFTTAVLANLTQYQYSAFGEDRDGELYVAALSSGIIYKIKELCSPFQLTGQVVQQNICTGTFNGIIEVQTTGGAGTVDYAWSNGQPGDFIVYLEAGDYVVTATDGNGCVRVDTFTMTNQFPDPPTPTILGGDLYMVCPGDSLYLEASVPAGDYNFTWLINGQVYAILPDNTITFAAFQNSQVTVQISDLNSSCQSLQSNPVTVLVSIPPTPAVQLVAGEAILCPGDTAVLGVAGVPPGYTFQWFNNGAPVANGADDELAVTDSGNYAVQVTGPCGEFMSADFSIDVELALEPIIGLAGDSLFLISATECNGCQWYYNNEPIPGAQGLYHIAAQSGAYFLETTSTNGCHYQSASLDVVVSGTALPESVVAFSLAPNPTVSTMLLTLELRQWEKMEIALVDAKGQIIFRQTPQGRAVRLPIDLHLLPAGTYLLKIDLENGSITRKVVKI